MKARIHKSLMVLLSASALWILPILSPNASAEAVQAEFVSPIVWRGDGTGDYVFDGNGKLSGAQIAPDGSVQVTGSSGSCELKNSYTTAGSITGISANWSFTGEVTLEISATGKSKDYVPIVNGVPLVQADFTAGDKIMWKATLVGAESTLSEVKIAYTEISGVAGTFGNPKLSGFLFRKPIHIAGGQTDLFQYQIPISLGESAAASGANVTLQGVVQADFADCRFTQADGETLLAYWLEDITGTAPDRTATFFVKIPHIPAAGIQIYLYYGNAAAGDLSDGDAVFDFFDDFRGDTALDTTKWTGTMNTGSSAITLTAEGLQLDDASVKSAAYNLTDGIMEYKAKSTGSGAIIGVIRGTTATSTGTGKKKEATKESAMGYSSNTAGSEHSIVVGSTVKANDAEAISLDTYYNYRIDANAESLTFRRYNADKSLLEAEAQYDDTGGLTSGFIELSTSSGGTGVHYSHVIVRTLVLLPPAVDTAKTSAAQEEVPNIATFTGLTTTADGNLTLDTGQTTGEYISPLINADFKARIIVPSWTTAEGAIAVDISAKEYEAFKTDCESSKFYYASKEDFTSGDALRWRASFDTGDAENQAGGYTPILEAFTMDYREGSISIIAPNGGEFAKAGKKYNFEYDASDYEASYDLKFEYSLDGGITYTTFVLAAKNTGKYSWTVPDILSTSAVVRISDALAPEIYDASDNYFTIVEDMRNKNKNKDKNMEPRDDNSDRGGGGGGDDTVRGGKKIEKQKDLRKVDIGEGGEAYPENKLIKPDDAKRRDLAAVETGEKTKHIGETMLGVLETAAIKVSPISEGALLPATDTLAVAPVAAIELTLGVSNPSGDSATTTDVRFNLPQGVVPEAILDTGGLNLGYDVASKSFYVFQYDITLLPGEQKVFPIKIKDMWRVPDEEIETLREYAKDLLSHLKGSRKSGQGEVIADDIFFNLAEIGKTQNLSVPTSEHIAFYSANKETLEEVKENLARLEKIADRSGDAAKIGTDTIFPAGKMVSVPIFIRAIFSADVTPTAITWKIIFGIVMFAGVAGAVFLGLWLTEVRRARKRLTEEHKKARDEK